MIEYWIWLSTRKRIGAKNAVSILNAFGSAEAVYRADRAELEHTPGITAAMLPALLDKSLAGPQKILADCYANDIRIFTLHEEGYPATLRAIADPPPVLYVKGDLPETEERPVIGIVGSRNASAYGMSVAEQLGYALHEGGCTVISGMAKGIDGAAMRGALKSGDRVIGVLGCGVDRIYPKENADLYRELITRGCIMSEYPPGTPPVPENFPSRNRIISGISDGVLIVEAAKKSGSLITAEYALEQNRDIFAVPANIGLPACEGSNRLLKNGAELVQSANDILEAYRYRYPDTVGRAPEITAPAPTGDAPQNSIDTDKTVNYIDIAELKGKLPQAAISILRALDKNTLTMDELIEASGLSAGTALSMLTLLEIKGFVQQLAGSRFCRLR